MTSQPVRTVPYSVLVVGSGAREHALVWALARSPSVREIWAAPGNPGIATMAQMVNIPMTDVEAIAAWAEAHEIGLVVVGPEVPLALGLADLLDDRGIPVFGPSCAAAELEWSKAFAKDFMRRHGIPTAAYGVFTESETAVDFIRTAGGPLVVKADGLGRGRGCGPLGAGRPGVSGGRRSGGDRAVPRGRGAERDRCGRR
jgi:phosphoribosylamine--glycine ligase